jgi:hypothetical protein
MEQMKSLSGARTIMPAKTVTLRQIPSLDVFMMKFGAIAAELMEPQHPNAEWEH